MTAVWALLAAAGLLWPDRIVSAVDGIPLDRAVEALLLGGVFPTLCIAYPAFLRTRFARACIVALVGWKVCAALFFVQEGWCVRFEPSRPYAKDAHGAPHAWDLRADWRAADPECSAIATRPYTDIADFPAWFFNLPPPDESWPQPQDRPPGATTRLHATGFVIPASGGVFRVESGADMQTATWIDGQTAQGDARLAPGAHLVAIDAVLTGDRWALVPLWNDRDLWSSVMTTVRRPSRVQLRLHAVAAWAAPALAAALLATWTVAAITQVAGAALLAWTLGVSIAIAWLLMHDDHTAARWSIAALAFAAAVPVPARLRNSRGVFVLVGVPWITFVLVISAPAIGRWFLYGVGHDFWMYQRYGYRIVMQGYWLEGGSPTFWFQPLYRWISGLLHVVFGDSSVGEWWWDGACLLAGAMFAGELTRRFAGFRYAIGAAALTLGVFVLGAAWNLIGVGLGEISASGLMSLAALAAIAGRRRGAAMAAAAGVLATLAFYTRLNHLPMAFGIAAFALPVRVSTAALVRPARWWRRVAWPVVLIVAAVVAVGVLLFAWRTYHYTGVFSVFHGTQRGLLSTWQPGATIVESLRRTAGSVLMVLTVNDPPRFDVYALPVLAGAGAAVLALAGAPVFRGLPAAAVLFLLTSVASALVARGSAYPGRFSVHVMPITCSLTVCAIAAFARGWRRARTKT
jgi:hypothetical protein